MRYLIGIVLSVCCTVLSAQSFTVSVTEELKFGEDAIPIAVDDGYIGWDGESNSKMFFNSRRNKLKYNIELKKYDEQMKQVKSYKLSGGEKLYGPFEPTLRKVFGSVFLFYYLISDENKISLLASRVDEASLIPESPHEVLVMDYNDISAFSNEENAFILQASPDHTKLLLLRQSDAQDLVLFSVLTDDMKIIRSGRETIKDVKSFSLSSCCIDDAGAIYLTCMYEYTKGFPWRLLINYPDAITKIIPIELPGVLPYEAFTVVSKDNKVRIIGTYRKTYLIGVFLQSLNSSGESLETVMKTPFPETLISQFKSDGWAGSDGLDATIHFYPFILDDGSLDLVGEFRRTQSYPRFTSMISGSILNARFGEGTVVFSRIPKWRESPTGIGDSFFPFPYQDRMIILYNDVATNLARDIDKPPLQTANHVNSVLAAAIIDVDGIVKREIVIDQNKENYLPAIEDIQRPALSSALVPLRKITGIGRLKESFKWGLLEIK